MCTYQKCNCNGCGCAKKLSHFGNDPQNLSNISIKVCLKSGTMIISPGNTTCNPGKNTEIPGRDCH
jgi:hypothetical protein